MAVVRKKQDDKYLKQLRELVNTGAGNRQCFDCGQKGPTYVNMTIGTFVCTRCSGVLWVFLLNLHSAAQNGIRMYENYAQKMPILIDVVSAQRNMNVSNSKSFEWNDLFVGNAQFEFVFRTFIYGKIYNS